jgi:hypothetical protein
MLMEEAIQVVKRTRNIFANGEAEVVIRKVMDVEDFRCRIHAESGNRESKVQTAANSLVGRDSRSRA